MTSIDYFATFEESVEIVRALTKDGFRIIVEPQLADAPEAITFTSVDETLTSILSHAPVFYLAGPFTRFDVAFTQLEGGMS